VSGEIERRPGSDPEERDGQWVSPPGRIDRERRRHADGNGWRPHPDGPGYPSARRAGELDPEWVMAGVDVPAGKRLYASRDLKGSAFELAMDRYGNGDGWHLTTTMQHMLIITRPTYAECLAELMRIWANWENEGRELPAGHAERRAL